MGTEVYSNIDELWLNVVHEIVATGQEMLSRAGQMKEVVGYRATLLNIESTFLLNPRRKLSPMYAAAETLWYLSGMGKIEMLIAYAPQYVNFAEDGIAFGAYGARMKHYNQLSLLIDILQKSPNSRQALISFWQGWDLEHAYRGDHKDLPCTMSLQFLIRNKALHLIATMRSNDAWLGLPYDVFAFTCLQRLIADALNVNYGTYTHQVGSMHLYEKNWKAAEEALLNTIHYVDDRRLQHHWFRDTKSWKAQIQTALCAEGRYRNKLNGIAEHRSLGEGMLYDLVSCCAQQFGHDTICFSPVLRKAFQNAKKK